MSDVELMICALIAAYLMGVVVGYSCGITHSKRSDA